MTSQNVFIFKPPLSKILVVPLTAVKFKQLPMTVTAVFFTEQNRIYYFVAKYHV